MIQLGKVSLKDSASLSIWHKYVNSPQCKGKDNKQEDLEVRREVAAALRRPRVRRFVHREREQQDHVPDRAEENVVH